MGNWKQNAGIQGTIKEILREFVTTMQNNGRSLQHK